MFDPSQYGATPVSQSTTPSATPQGGGQGSFDPAQYGATPAASPIMGSQFLGNLVNGASNFLPVAGGIGGSLLGGALGLETGPGAIATGIAGGGVGQGLGEAAKEWLQQDVTHTAAPKGANIGDIAKQAATGGIFGALPGGGEVANPLLRYLMRFGAGAGVNAGATAIQNIGKPQAQQSDVGKSALLGGAANLIIPGLINTGAKTMGNLLNFAGEKVPQDIIEQTGIKPAELLQSLNKETMSNLSPQQTAQNLFRTLSEKQVGAGQVDTFIKRGIINPEQPFTPEAISASLGKAKQVSTQLEQQLQDELAGKTSQTTLGDLNGQIDTIMSRANPLVKNPNGEMIKSLLQGNVSQDVAKTLLDNAGMSAAAKKQVMESLMGKTIDEGSGVDLQRLNTVKRFIGNAFDVGDNQTAGDLYQLFKNEIEQSGGDKIQSLNNEAFDLMKGKSVLNKWDNAMGAYPAGSRPLEVSQTIQGAKNTLQDQLEKNAAKADKEAGNIPASLKTAETVGTLGGAVGTGVVAKAMGLPGMLFSGFMGRWLIANMLKNALSDPEARLRLAETLQSGFENTALPAMQSAQSLPKIIQQLSIRGANALGQ